MTNFGTMDTYRELLERLLLDEYTIFHPQLILEEAVDVTVDPKTMYKGVLKVGHKGDASFFGMIKSETPWLSIEEAIFHCEDQEPLMIHYTIEGSKVIGPREEMAYIGLYYLGGYQQVAICCHLKEVLQPVQVAVKETEALMKLTLDRASYGAGESGHIRVETETKEPITLKILQQSPYLHIDQDIYEVSGQLDIPFRIQVSEQALHQGLISLANEPCVSLPLVVQGHLHGFRTKEKLSIEVTRYPVIGDHVLTDYQAYSHLKKEVEKDAVAYFVFGYDQKKKNWVRKQIGAIGSLIAFDPADIECQLLLVLWLIEGGHYSKAQKSINAIEPFMLYFDQYKRDISDVLMVLVTRMSSHPEVGRFIGRWSPDSVKEPLKLLLLGQEGQFRHVHYQAMEEAYQDGICNDYMKKAAYAYVNAHQYIPSEASDFYKMILLEGMTHYPISPKLLRRFETGIYLVSKHQVIDYEIAKALYNQDKSRQLFTLLTVMAMEAGLESEAGLKLYHQCLSQKLAVKDVLKHYILASYHNGHLLDLSFFRFAYDIDQFDKDCQSYILYNLRLEKDAYPVLYRHYRQKYPHIKSVPKDIILSVDMDKNRQFLQDMYEEGEIPVLMDLYELGLVKMLKKEDQLTLVPDFYDHDAAIGYQLALGLYRETTMDEASLQIICKHFHGDYTAFSQLIRVAIDMGLYHEFLFMEHLLMCLLTRQETDFVVTYAKHFDQWQVDFTIKALVLHYLAALVVIESLEVGIEVLEVLADFGEEEGVIGCEVALLKRCSESPDIAVHFKKWIGPLLEKHVQKGVVFHFYKQLIEEKAMGYQLRAQDYFEYYAHASKQVHFCYRLDESDDYTKQPMTHIVFGLFLAKVVLFYGEHIQYYIEEVDGDGYDIRSSDVYLEERVLETENEDNLFDLVNTITMSRRLEDEESLEKAIDAYRYFREEKLGKTYLL